MAQQFTDQYPIDPRPGEIERLRIQSDVIAAETERMLDLIAIQAGWRCTSP